MKNISSDRMCIYIIEIIVFNIIEQVLFDFDLIYKDYYYSILFKFKRLFFILFVKISLHRS
jgi:hypothetical protein